MGTDKPLISILMAVYEPRMDWLREQLLSLNAQTYPNLRLYVRDDCSPSVPYEQIQSCVQDCISAFPYEIRRNENNLGSNETFECLTREAEGVYFAYCDQDDVWLPEKLKTLENGIATQPNCLLVCSDMYIIDGDGAQVADSITKVRRHHVFHSGAGLAEGLLFHNFVTGCTMLIDATTARDAVPFCPQMVHDHYLALWCAERGAVLTLEQPLIRYRIHGGNQTGIIGGVMDKESYGRIRINTALDRVLWLDKNFLSDEHLKKTISQAEKWLQARQRNWGGQGGAATIWKYRRFSPLTSVAEICLRSAPNWLFMQAINTTRKNWI